VKEEERKIKEWNEKDKIGCMGNTLRELQAMKIVGTTKLESGVINCHFNLLTSHYS